VFIALLEFDNLLMFFKYYGHRRSVSRETAAVTTAAKAA
jgi:uncharacterized protein (DUF486 family)